MKKPSEGDAAEEDGGGGDTKGDKGKGDKGKGDKKDKKEKGKGKGGGDDDEPEEDFVTAAIRRFELGDPSDVAVGYKLVDVQRGSSSEGTAELTLEGRRV